MKAFLSFSAVLIFVSCTRVTVHAQTEEPDAGRISPKELSIPASPVFDLMNVTPSQITRTSDIKDFKVDWSFNSWKLSPNMAIQSQPVWELFYNRRDLSKYQNTSAFMRRLASLDVSIGTVQDENDDRRIGFALKLNVLRQKDPLMARELYTGLDEKYREEKNDLEARLRILEKQLDTTTNILDKPEIRGQIKALEDQMNTINSRRMTEVNGRAKIFVAEHWNASSLDIAVGRVYSYKTDSAGSLTSLRLNRNTGAGAWLNGNLGIGKKCLLSALFRTNWYEEELEFTIRNRTTQEEQSQKAIARNTLFSMGMNFRYGNSIYTFFAEILFEKKGLNTPVAALNDAFKSPDNFEVVGSSVKWSVVHPNTISIGGDWRISRSVVLNYGMRCIFDSGWNMQTFTPIASISCMMR